MFDCQAELKLEIIQNSEDPHLSFHLHLFLDVFDRLVEICLQLFAVLRLRLDDARIFRGDCFLLLLELLAERL